MKQVINKKCRICDSNDLYEVVALNDMPFTDEFVTESLIGKEYLANIEIGICGQCGISQNLNNTNMDNYYNDYEYSVGGSKFANSFMDTLAKKTKELFFKDYDYMPSVLEIGSGSGEQLMMFKKYGFSVIGVEPSEYLTNYANSNDITTIHDFFYAGMLDKIKEKYLNIDCVVSSYTFDHIPYINETFDAIKSILKPDGKLIIEVHDLDLIIQRKEYCLFEHEHYIYLNKATAKYLFEKNGFEIVTYDLLDEKEKRGNSLLIVAQKKSNNLAEVMPQPKKEIDRMKDLNFNIQTTINKIDTWLEKNQDKKLVAYGAGGRGVMTIAALKNYKNFKYVVDQNPKGENIFLPKTHLLVEKPQKLASDNADLILVFSYGYFEEIIESLSIYDYTRDQFVSLLDFV